MPFSLIDNDETNIPEQAMWMQTDISALVAGINGIGVLSGCGVTAPLTASMLVAVTSGEIQLLTGTVAIQAADVAITAAHLTQLRIDLIVANYLGVISTVNGVAALKPKAADIPASSVLLAMVYVLPSVLAITSALIVDKRIVILNASVSPVISEPGTSNPLMSISGAGAREPQIVGYEYSYIPRGLSTEISINRVQLYGPYWVEQGGSIHDNVLRADLIPGTSNQALRAVLYADDGLASKYDLGTAAISRPTTVLAVGTEVVINANSAPGRYSFPVSHTFGGNGYMWLGLWGGTATVGAEVRLAAYSGPMGHHRVRSTAGTANYSSIGMPPTLTTGNTTLTNRNEASIHFAIKAVSVSVPTLSLLVNNDASITLTVISADPRTTDYQIERSSDAGATYTNLGVIKYKNPASLNDPDLIVGQSYLYRVGARYRTANPAIVTATAIATGSHRAYVHVTFPALPATTAVHNPMRGLIENPDGSVNPTGTLVYEQYSRGWNWELMQPISQTNYNYAYGDEAIASAVSRNLRVWLRWRAHSSFTAGAEVPQWLIDAGLTVNGIPLWNNETVVSYMEDIYLKLGIRYSNNKAVVAIDVGGLYNFGEWSGSDGGGDISVANAKRLIAAACNAFPNTIVVVNVPNSLLDQAIYESLLLFPNLHIRQDGFGGDFTGGEDVTASRMTGGNRSELARSYMRYSGRVDALNRAVGRYAEPFGGIGSATPDPAGFILMRDAATGLKMSAMADTNLKEYSTYTAAGKQALLDMVRIMGYRYRIERASYPTTLVNSQSVLAKTWWHNDGTASTFESWRPQWQLRNGTTTIVAQVDSSLYLRDVYPTEGSPCLHEDSIVFSGVTPGIYKLCVQVPRLNSFTVDMRLAHVGETSKQYTELGNVTIS